MDVRKRKRFIGKLLLSLLLLSSFIGTSVLAEGEETENGKVIFSLPQDFDEEEAEDFEDGGLVVGLFKVADIIWNGKTAKWEFDGSDEVDAILAKYFSKGETGYIIDPDETDVVEKMEAAAKELADLVESGNLDPDLLELDVENEVPEGLYLTVPHGKETEEYIKTIEVENEEGETEEVTVSFAYTTAKEYDFTLNLLPVSAAQYKITNEPVEVVLKPSEQPRMGKVQIDKTLLSGLIGTDGNFVKGTFVFKITAVFEDEIIYDDVRSLTFSELGEQSVIDIPEMPVGTEVTIEEVYSGSAYRLVEGAENPITKIIDKAYVETDEEPYIVHFEFENEYAENNNHGYGVDNAFENDPETGWSWSNNLGGGQQ